MIRTSSMFLNQIYIYNCCNNGTISLQCQGLDKYQALSIQCISVRTDGWLLSPRLGVS